MTDADFPGVATRLDFFGTAIGRGWHEIILVIDMRAQFSETNPDLIIWRGCDAGGMADADLSILTKGSRCGTATGGDQQ